MATKRAAMASPRTGAAVTVTIDEALQLGRHQALVEHVLDRHGLDPVDVVWFEFDEAAAVVWRVLEVDVWVDGQPEGSVLVRRRYPWSGSAS